MASVQDNLLRLPRTQSGALDELTRALISGSDTRLAVDARTSLNGYLCQPFPRPAEFSLSSSTASTISPSAYAAAEAAFRELHRDPSGQACEQLAEKLRHDIRALLDLSSTEAEIVLAPSGTDSALHALYLARCALGKPAISVVVAAAESGSGVPLAASGRHFDSVTPAGRKVVKGDPITGLATQAMTIPVAVRDRNGDPLPAAAVDREVGRCVSAALASGNGVVLQVMNHSKMGGRYPSLECVADIIAGCGSSVQVVVDACQARLSRSRLKWYLDRNCLVLITGSKFFAGPPLSGALLVPAALSMRMAELRAAPEGLADYTTRYDWPMNWRGVRAAWPTRMPVGQTLRWIAAAAEMRAYFAVPEFVRKLLLKEFGAALPRLLARCPHLRLVGAGEAPASGEDGDEFAAPTIFPVVMMRGDEPLTTPQARKIYRALNDDVSALVGQQPTQAARDAAASLCHLGQPVAIAERDGAAIGAIRISADARFVHQCWSQSNRTIAVDTMQRKLAEVRIALDKIELLLQSFDQVDRAYASAL